MKLLRQNFYTVLRGKGVSKEIVVSAGLLRLASVTSKMASKVFVDDTDKNF